MNDTWAKQLKERIADYRNKNRVEKWKELKRIRNNYPDGHNQIPKIDAQIDKLKGAEK
jgi:hypothetical protein